MKIVRWLLCLVVAVGCLPRFAIANDQDGRSEGNRQWNDKAAVMVKGKWANEKGMDGIHRFPKGDRDPRGHEYAEDFKLWASFLINTNFLPRYFESNAVPVRMGHLTCVGSASPSNAVSGKDGFIVRYKVNGYIVQLVDTRYDFQILIRELAQEKADYTYEEQAQFGESLMHLVLREELVQYPDGAKRKLTLRDFETHSYAHWNWQVETKELDDPTFAKTSLARPYLSFAKWRSDGRSVLIVFEKTYDSATDEIWTQSKRSRFEKDVLFHDRVLE